MKLLFWLLEEWGIIWGTISEWQHLQYRILSFFIKSHPLSMIKSYGTYFSVIPKLFCFATLPRLWYDFTKLTQTPQHHPVGKSALWSWVYFAFPAFKDFAVYLRAYSKKTLWSTRQISIQIIFDGNTSQFYCNNNTNLTICFRAVRQHFETSSPHLSAQSRLADEISPDNTFSSSPRKLRRGVKKIARGARAS